MCQISSFHLFKSSPISCTAQIPERKMSMTCGTASSAPRMGTLTLTSCHHVSTLYASTLKEPTTRLRSGAGVSRATHRYPHKLDMGGVSRKIVNWMSGEPAPEAVFELLSCRCIRKRRCQLPNCACLSNVLQCRICEH